MPDAFDALVAEIKELRKQTAAQATPSNGWLKKTGAAVGLLLAAAVVIGYLLMPRAEATAIHSALSQESALQDHRIESITDTLKVVQRNVEKIAERLSVRDIEKTEVAHDQH